MEFSCEHTFFSGNGYYLYPEVDKADTICDGNGTVQLLPNDHDEFDSYVINSIWYWWLVNHIIFFIFYLHLFLQERNCSNFHYNGCSIQRNV